ncbi:MAG TPA: hypothetical protein VFX47_06420 [Gammaproteobacteria bacterium]|nr:hypothetical protein [Gammaproteobacteria bacterium]
MKQGAATLLVISILAWIPMTAGASDFKHTWIGGGLYGAMADQPHPTDNGTGYFLNGSYAITDSIDLSGSYAHASGSYTDSCATYSQIHNFPLGNTYTVCNSSSSTYNGYTLGAGWHTDINSSLELATSLRYVRSQVHSSSSLTITPTPPPNQSSPNCIVPSNGPDFCFFVPPWTAEPGGNGGDLNISLRWRLAARLMLTGSVGHIRLSSQTINNGYKVDAYSANLLGAEFECDFNPNWAVVLHWVRYLPTDNSIFGAGRNDYQLGVRYNF